LGGESDADGKHRCGGDHHFTTIHSNTSSSLD
jgi:hypothetical protein